jgi:hypothetical protein
LFGLTRSGLIVPILSVVWACSAPSSDSIDITARLSPADPLFGAIEVRGLSKAALEHPGPDLLRVTAGEPGDTSTAFPPLAGRFVVDGEVLRFEPRYRPSEGLVLRALVKTDSEITETFELPRGTADLRPTTTVTGIYPSADTIPANHLRWYVEFSAPMREGEAEQHVHLLDTSGTEVDDAFLIVSEELWDPARRRLTVLFDPGRVKRGVRQNLESGAPLVAGRDYVLRIDQGWRDGRGVILAEGMEKRFHVVEAIRSGLDPAGWKVEAPRAGTREPVTIDFGRALDKALAERLVAVMAGDAMVTGQVSLASGERQWRLDPAQPWPDREFEVRVSPLLEDPAGNRVGQNFDRDRAAGEWQEGEAGQAVTIRFRPLLYSSARAR